MAARISRRRPLPRATCRLARDVPQGSAEDWWRQLEAIMKPKEKALEP